MKRFAVLLALSFLLCGCAAQKVTVQPQAAADIDPEKLAAQLWLKLSDEPRPQPLDQTLTAELLELKEADLAQTVAFMDPADPQGAQLFLLCAAPNKGERLQTALQNRCELVRQTAAARLGQKDTPTAVGCVASAGEWYALLVPSGMDEERTQQARQTFLAAFE